MSKTKNQKIKGGFASMDAKEAADLALSAFSKERERLRAEIRAELICEIAQLEEQEISRLQWARLDYERTLAGWCEDHIKTSAFEAERPTDCAACDEGRELRRVHLAASYSKFMQDMMADWDRVAIVNRQVVKRRAN